ncbi:unnamed protein product [Hyaloperonospora brassicae]|uniref:RNA helicase n=1 Tax=Hyaloperonospora brassicae TaxID=162125 RepID=A0AAV0TIN2_HYABA|nr:unnamed protein product [Hyaloperonospora brassicae]
MAPGRGKGRGRGRGGPRGSYGWYHEPITSLDESFCMSIHKALQSLVDDGERAELSFPSTYDNTQRRYIHMMAEKYGLFSKSAGRKGDGRFIHVASVKKNAAMEKVSLRLHPTPLNPKMDEWYPPEVKQYMATYPSPSLEDEGAVDPWGAKTFTPLGVAPMQHRGREALFSHLPSRGSQNGPKIVRTPLVEVTKLPVYQYREQILNLVEENQIVVLSADTGCGKSTQIPQFLLDDALARGRGKETRIICTQPRRISAMSLAQRVASERPGQSSKEVGYAIRFDSSFDAKQSKLIFCTTGTLLKWLNNDPSSLGFSHIILDEVHERDMFTDFLLILIKTSILKQRPDLKVILMSATIQVEKFSQYFQPEFHPPILQMVGGTNYPVSTLFLEDILALLKIDRTSSLPIMDDSQSGLTGDGSISQPGAPAVDNMLVCSLCGCASFEDEEAFGMHVATCFGKPSADCEAPRTPKQDTAPSAVPVSAMGDFLQAALRGIKQKAKNAALKSYTKQYDALQQDQTIDYNLLLQLLFLINRMFPLGEDGKGAILVFLPGWEEISFMEQSLLKSEATSATYEIALLHSRLAPEEQRRAFMTPPPGKRKLVLATNIAETSLTIEDVVFVVDCGKSKQTHALAATSASSFVMGLQTTWIARANCVQRIGRAGRVRAGVCFRLFSKNRYETAMKEYMPPQLLTNPLEELLLQIMLLQMDKKLDNSSAKAFLLEAMDAPSEASIDASLQRLVGMHALAKSKKKGLRLTLLGWHLAHICSSGVSIQMAKFLLWGHMFGCYDATLKTSCALSGYRDPFDSSLGMSKGDKQLVAAAKRAFTRNGSPPELTLQSDHFVLCKAFEAYLDVRSSCKTKRLFCAENRLNLQTLGQLGAIYKKLQQDLVKMGLSAATQLVPTSPANNTSNYGEHRTVFDGPQYRAGLHSKWKKRKREQEELGVHEWLVYHDMMQSGSTRVAKYGTRLPSVLLQALFMGSVKTQVVEERKTVVKGSGTDGESVASSTWLLALDDWITFEANGATEVRWLALLRERLHAAFARHLERLLVRPKAGETNALPKRGQQLRKHDVALVRALVAWVSSDLRGKVSVSCKR